jgi:hypothetical protein
MIISYQWFPAVVQLQFQEGAFFLQLVKKSSPGEVPNEFLIYLIISLSKNDF